MAYSRRTIPIIAASLVAILSIGAGYVLSGPNPLGIIGVSAENSEELLKEYAAKDTDSDQLPDWQEALYGTDPLNPQSHKEGMTDGEAVAQGLLTPKSLAAQLPTDPKFPATDTDPDSLTARFSQKFMERYLASRTSRNPSDEEVTALAQAAIADIVAEQSEKDAFDEGDLTISGAGKEALVAYAANAENALENNAAAVEKEDLVYFALALQNNDETALKSLEKISQGYHRVASALMEVTVPAEAAASHLALANALSHMGDATADMAALDEDPLRALVGIGSYRSYAADILLALAALNKPFAAHSIMIAAPAPGSGLISSMHTAAQTDTNSL